MQPDDKYIDKADDFSREVGEKLREHRMPVDPDVWDGLTGRLASRRKPVYGYWYWAAASVVVVVLSVLFLMNPSENDLLVTDHSPSSGQIEEETVVPDTIPEEIACNSDKKTVSGQVVEKKRSVSIKKDEISVVPKSEKVSKSEERTHSTEIEMRIASSASKQSVKPSESEDIKPEETGEQMDLLESVKMAVMVGPQNAEEAPVLEITPDQERRGGIRSLIAALGSGGTSLDFSSYDYVADYPQADSQFPGGDIFGKNGVNSSGQYNLLTPGDYNEVVHRMPVSFSLTADLPIAGDLTLETGLSYTYLFSRYRRNENIIYRGTLRQHYIGIPVNLRYSVWQGDTWNVYLLGGASIEKGLRSIYKQEIEYNGDVVYHTNLYSGIKGLQFSAQGGAGFSYRLRDGLSLFGEPKIVYYFKNNQPMSARTENPLIFGLNMGIRLQFK